MKNPTEEISLKIIERYYDNDLSLFWEYMADDVIWMGPATKQYVEGKDTLQSLYAKEDHNLQFGISDMTSKFISGSFTSCEVLLRFTVYTYFESGNFTRHDQRITFFWHRERDKKWRYKIIHISNGMNEIDDRDTIYPIHLDDYLQNQLTTRSPKKNRKRIMLHGDDHATHYICSGEVIYVEAYKKKSIMHTFSGSFVVMHLIEEVCSLLGDFFYRPHRSYLVNIEYIDSISRKEITMRDGSQIPVPQKKFNQVRDDVDALQKKNNI